MTSEIERQAILDRYKAAHLAANGRDVEISKGRGWYVIVGCPNRGYRIRQIEAMAKVLEARVRSTGPDTRSGPPDQVGAE